jgi:hypothetical protein
MNKLKQFLNSFEEDYLFRYGKRSWQVISLIFFLILSYTIVQYLWNLRPSSREEVSISKIEFDRSRIDYDFDITNDIDKATLADYNKVLKGLKGAMPYAEWEDLGDSVAKSDFSYVPYEAYDPYWGFSYTDYRRIETKYKVFEKNRDAIPNILEDIYEAKGIDSLQYSEKIKVLNLAKALIAYSSKKNSTNLLRDYFKSYLIYAGQLTPQAVKDLAATFKKVDRKPYLHDPYGENDDWSEFSYYLSIGQGDSLTQERFEIANNALAKLKNKVKFKEKEQAHYVARIVLGSYLSNEDLKKATEEFFASKDYKLTEKNAGEIFGKYMGLFSEKVNLAEGLLAEEKAEKESNRSEYYQEGRYAFVAIILIAAILILFSIRQIIKSRG